MRSQRPPNPLGHMLVGGLITAGIWQLLVALDSLSDPVAAFALGILLLAGVWTFGVGIFDVFRVLLLQVERRIAETPTGIFGEAAFADLRDCADCTGARF